VPAPPEILVDTPVDSDKEDTDRDQDFQCDPCGTEHQLLSQSKLNDLVKDLGLPKDSGLKSKNLLSPAPVSHSTGTEKKSLFHISLKMGT
jgi:hypothetical protein